MHFAISRDRPRDTLRAQINYSAVCRYRVCLDLKKGHGHFDRWKSGVDPRMNTVYDLAVYFDVTLDYLIGRER